MIKKRNVLFFKLFLCLAVFSIAQSQKFTRHDTLRGYLSPERTWFDVMQYELFVMFDIPNKSISGACQMTFKKKMNHTIMQIDLQQPMIMDSILFHNKKMSFKRDSNTFFIDLKKSFIKSFDSIQFFYHGMPAIAKNAPWDGGFIYKKDANKKDWIAVACQGFGASSWWPCKDHQSDEPDSGMKVMMAYPDSLVGISNGRLIDEMNGERHFKASTWEVKNPINSYDFTFYLGDYVSWKDTMMGEKGVLDLEYYVLRSNLEKAKKQFQVVKPMLHAFEYWMGPYPFYEDGYKLVDAPYLGMEHQSAVAYGNQYKMGYLGRDRSGTGHGLLFDFIIVHESGHEWFGNNITAKDVADNWIHEGFTTYTETMFAEQLFGKEKAWAYCRGQRKNIQNDKPCIGTYNVQQEGSDIYDKASNMIHTIRQVVNDDKVFRNMIREMNKQFYHQAIETGDIEKFMSTYTKMDLSKIFDQYLRSSQAPKLEYAMSGKNIKYRWNCNVAKFNMPLKIMVDNNEKWIYPTDTWKILEANELKVDENFYIKLEKVEG
jgi:aminopeptidase N